MSAPRSPNEREVRFGLKRGDQRSGTYIIAGTPTTDDVYVMSRHVGVQYKASLHQSGSWRISVEPIDPATGQVGPPIGGQTWTRPQPFAPGLTKAFAVLIPGGAIGTPLTPDVEARVHLYDVPVGAEAVQFTVLYAQPGVRSSTWPGADAMRTTLVGKFTLPISQERVFVVAHGLETAPTPAPKAATGQLLPGVSRDDFRRALEEGSLRAVMFGIDDDGTAWFMDGRGVQAAEGATANESPHDQSGTMTQQ